MADSQCKGWQGYQLRPFRLVAEVLAVEDDCNKLGCSLSYVASIAIVTSVHRSFEPVELLPDGHSHRQSRRALQTSILPTFNSSNSPLGACLLILRKQSGS